MVSFLNFTLKVKIVPEHDAKKFLEVLVCPVLELIPGWS
jgi:hypothetical protein